MKQGMFIDASAPDYIRKHLQDIHVALLYRVVQRASIIEISTHF
jgi:hypothetical protein